MNPGASRGLYFYGTDQIDSALSCFRKTIKLNWNTPYAYYYLGEHLLQQGDSLNRVTGLGMAAVRFFERDDRRGHLLLGQAYMELGKYKLAMSSFRSGVKAIPDDAELNYFLGKAHYYLDNKSEARKYLKKSLTLKDRELTADQRREAQKILSQV